MCIRDSQLIAQQQRNLEEKRSSLQADGNRIGKEVGQKIKGGADPKGEEVADLRRQGNQIKQQVAVLEEEEKELSAKLREQLLSFPNLPSPQIAWATNRTTRFILASYSRYIAYLGSFFWRCSLPVPLVVTWVH